MSQTFRGETLIGKQFENWIVLEFIPNDKKGSYWKCECLCSLKTQKTIEKSQLTRGSVKSCGCLLGNNLLNQRFGNLIVVEKTDQRKSGKIIWKCLCDCGKETLVRSDYLNNGNTKSCGCLKSGINNLLGQKFGRLTVIKQAPSAKNRCACWECLCDCGKTTIVRGTNLVNGATKSCKCLTAEVASKDLLNQRFGKLTVIEKMEERNSYGSIIWKCLCDCDNIALVRSSSLINGSTQSCGCIKSIGEANIKRILTENGIPHIPQYTFSNLLSPLNTGQPLRFDFAIFVNDKLSHLIEFQGQQHEDPNSFWNTLQSFEEQQLRDKTKVDYCKNNNIPLIRIPYKMRDNITLELLLLENNPFLVASM